MAEGSLSFTELEVAANQAATATPSDAAAATAGCWAAKRQRHETPPASAVRWKPAPYRASRTVSLRAAKKAQWTQWMILFAR